MKPSSLFSLGERTYRALTADEISALESQGCQAEDWTSVQVDPGFETSRLRRVTFSGRVSLGRFRALCELSPRVRVPSGISDAVLSNVTVGNDCYISGIRRGLSDYVVADGAVLSDVGEISMSGESSFSVGLVISVLSETGARPLPVFPGLFPQLAYVLTYYSHRSPQFDSQTEAMVKAIAAPYVSSVGYIGEGARVTGCKEVRNVYVCAGARLQDAGVVRDCYVGSRALVGAGVFASECVIDRDAEVFNQVSVLRSYVGPYAILEHGLLAQESAFFQGSHFAAGETCSLLAGPFSVSHHKATLMIATQTSFFNAGSGSNQSNHSYKLGPNKYGMLERGAKCGSSSYLFWPARIGAFSTVLGHHMSHFDLSLLPFSYIIDGQGKTIVVPGLALRSIGTVRDEAKWKKRSAAWGADTAPLSSATFSPFTAGRLIAGVRLLRNLQQEEAVHWLSPLGHPCEGRLYQDCYITNKNIHHGIELYTDALFRYLFGAWLRRAVAGLPVEADESGTGEWTDLMGGYYPLAELKDGIEAALEVSPAEACEALSRTLLPDRDLLDRWEWNWQSRALREFFGFNPVTAGADDKRSRLEDLRHRLHHAQFMLRLDADKEFNQTARMMYGLDGDEAACTSDFETGMGTLETDSTCLSVMKETEAEEALIDALLAKL